MAHDCGHARYDHRVGSHFVPFWYRTGERVRHHVDVRSVGELIYGGVCIARDLRFDPEPQGTRRGIKHLIHYGGTETRRRDKNMTWGVALAHSSNRAIIANV